MSSTARALCTVICAIWLLVAAVHVATYLHGPAGDRAALAWSVVSGLSALVGLLVALRGRRT